MVATVPAAVFSMFICLNTGLWDKSVSNNTMRMDSMAECSIYLKQQLDEAREQSREIIHQIDKPTQQQYKVSLPATGWGANWASVSCQELTP